MPPWPCLPHPLSPLPRTVCPLSSLFLMFLCSFFSCQLIFICFLKKKWKNGKGSPSLGFLSLAQPSLRELGQDVASQEAKDGISFINSLVFGGGVAGQSHSCP